MYVQGSPNTFFWRNFTKETLSSVTSSQQISAKNYRDKKFLKQAVRHPQFLLMSYACSNNINENLHDTIPCSSIILHQQCSINYVQSSMFHQACPIKHVQGTCIICIGFAKYLFFGERNFTKETLSSATSSQQIAAKDCRDKKISQTSRMTSTISLNVIHTF